MPSLSSPGVKALDVWDVLVAQITTPASIGELLDEPVLTDYMYNTPLASGAQFGPPNKTIIISALLTVAAKLEVYAILQLLKAVPAATEFGHVGPFLGISGFLLKFKNTDGGSQNLMLVGVEYK